jgi:hypothetical protein
MTVSSPTGSATVSQLSPELALVDSKLAAAADELRELARHLRERRVPDVAPAVQVPPTPVRAPTQAPATAAPKPAAITSPPVRARRERFATVALVACASAIAAGALGLVPAAAHRAGASPAAAPASPSDLQARATRQARAARTYVWSAVPGAQAYEVKIHRDGRVVHEVTTRRLAVVLPERLRFSPGRYTLSVTPASGLPASAPAAGPVVETTFVVAPD